MAQVAVLSWTQAVTKEQELQAASYICIAHDIVVASQFALFVTHNDFQQPSLDDRTGLIPRWTGEACSVTDCLTVPDLFLFCCKLSAVRLQS